MKIYVLQHELDGLDEVKLIGVYASRDEAEAARERSRELPGFADHRDGFAIDAYELGQDHWSEGFATVPNAASERRSDQAAWLPYETGSALKR